MEILKAIWADATAHQLIVSACIAVVSIAGLKIGGVFGSIITKLTDFFGANIKH